MNPFSVHCASPFLVASFPQPQAVLSWSLTRPGFAEVSSVAWLYVRDADLSMDVDPALLLRKSMQSAGLTDAVHLMTSRDITKHHMSQASFGRATATCLATVGLGNAVRVGSAPVAHQDVGTINLLVHVDRPLSQAALVETISIVAQARTVAMIDLPWKPSGLAVTGTGTDCIVVATPIHPDMEQFAGLHTDIGAAVGRAVYDAVWSGGHVWIAEQQRTEARSTCALAPPD
jgi:adenosylcobinamide amidohydrolase